MKYVAVGDYKLPAVAVGCMGLAGAEEKQQRDFVSAALGAGLNFFDHADIYGGGECESAFGRAVKALKIPRDKLVLQSKCGIVPGKMYDFSKEHIVEAVNGSLKRLGTDYLDLLLLHRPDPLFEPDEVAEAFDELEGAGKVRAFGVSNMHPYQIELLKSRIGQAIVADQLQFSAAHAGMVSCGMEVNMLTAGAASHDGYILDYCRLKEIAVQAWSPFRYGFFEGVFLDDAKFEKLNGVLARLGEKYGVSKSAVAAAWILRHPAKMQVVTGTSKAARLLEIAAGADVVLTREEWYEVYLAAGYMLP